MLELALTQFPFGAEKIPALRQLQRQRLPISRIAAADPRLATVYAAWSARRQGGLLPEWSGAEIHDLRPSIDRLQVLETAEGRPASGRFQRAVDVLGEDQGYDSFSGFMDLPLAFPTTDAIVRGLIEDYTNVAFFGSPALHRVTVAADEGTRSFHRLILPLAADRRRVSLLLVALNAA